MSRVVNGSQTVNFYYDATGRRTQKSIGTTHYEYLYDGDKLLQMSVQTPSGWSNMNFVYDSQGIMGFTYKDKKYIYVRNLFGDITDIYCEDHCVAKYTYDAWGNCTAQDLSDSNEESVHEISPFRYRGYVYDQETGLYYCNTRYYSPEWGRFVNADAINYLAPEVIGGLNLYAYCLNNPVMSMDPTGTHSVSTALAILIIGLMIGIAGGVIAGFVEDKRGWDFVGTVLKGALIGLMVAGAVVLLIGVFSGAALAFSGKILGMTAHSAAITTSAQFFAIGSLAVDIPAVIIGAIKNVEWPLFEM